MTVLGCGSLDATAWTTEVGLSGSCVIERLPPDPAATNQVCPGHWPQECERVIGEPDGSGKHPQVSGDDWTPASVSSVPDPDRSMTGSWK